MQSICPAAEKKKTAAGQELSYAYFSYHLRGGFEKSRPPLLTITKGQIDGGP